MRCSQHRDGVAIPDVGEGVSCDKCLKRLPADVSLTPISKAMAATMKKHSIDFDASHEEQRQAQGAE